MSSGVCGVWADTSSRSWLVPVRRVLGAACERFATIHLHRCFLVKGFFSNIVYKCFTLSEPDPAVYQLPSRNEVRLEPFCAPLRKSKPRASESGMLKGYNGALLSAMHFCRRGSLLRQLDKLARLIARLQTTHEAMCKSRVWNLAKGLACIGSSEELERSCLCTTRAPMTMRDESLRTIFHVQSCSSSVRIPFQGDDA